MNNRDELKNRNDILKLYEEIMSDDSDYFKKLNADQVIEENRFWFDQIQNGYITQEMYDKLNKKINDSQTKINKVWVSIIASMLSLIFVIGLGVIFLKNIGVIIGALIFIAILALVFKMF